VNSYLPPLTVLQTMARQAMEGAAATGEQYTMTDAALQRFAVYGRGLEDAGKACDEISTEGAPTAFAAALRRMAE
jgi:hypothetical protein